MSIGFGPLVVAFVGPLFLELVGTPADAEGADAAAASVVSGCLCFMSNNTMFPLS